MDPAARDEPTVGEVGEFGLITMALTYSFAIVLPRPDGDAELDGLFVHPDRQRLGLGRELVAASADLARATGASALHATANDDAPGL